MFQHVVQELDGRPLVALGVDAQHPQAGAVVDRGELVVLPSLGRGWMNLTSSWTRWPGSGLLVALPAPVVALVALGGREAVEVQAFEDPPPLSG